MENLEWSWLVPTFLQALGLAIGLAIVGFGYERAIREHKSITNLLTQTGYAKWLAIGGAIFTFGLCFTRISWEYKIVGILLGGLLSILAFANRASTMDEEHEAVK